jgi:hypothetical protein
MANRRSFLQSTFGLGAGLFASRSVAETTHNESHTSSQAVASGGYQVTSSGSLAHRDVALRLLDYRGSCKTYVSKQQALKALLAVSRDFGTQYEKQAPHQHFVMGRQLALKNTRQEALKVIAVLPSRATWCWGIPQWRSRPARKIYFRNGMYREGYGEVVAAMHLRTKVRTCSKQCEMVGSSLRPKGTG